ncbi:ribonuclease H-like domain-containing protein, partial [Desulfurivibrio sp. D14AmB]|uniref:ribonuclease H-like domain-containing protein n=1 Tax=Desulfurivibrio sp. D14AmB TaxID=3374370 RepID=UPI00376EC7BE
EKHLSNNRQLQLPLFGNETTTTLLDDSLRAYQLDDMDFFADRLPPHLYYRIPLTFPDETMFLDIETTGLSIYYDIITIIGWSVGKSYHVFITGQDDTEFRAAITQAKAIVTFNGKMFDLKFISKFWPDMPTPPIHVDLRYMAKRVGLTGGQKVIEKQIGYKRNKNVESMLGEAAPILWHKYRRGDKKALKKLITYNHEDVEGMKLIFDYCVKKRVEIEAIPQEIAPTVKFSSLRSKVKWKGNSKTNAQPVINLPDFSQPNRPLCHFEDLNNILDLHDATILGVDLVSSETRKSGCCVLQGNNATTRSLLTDDEIIKLAEECAATLVSIDSPLSIPEGRTSFYDEDPFREYGIMRHCERVLKRRGINVYPCLIPSMQKLTRRGMVLAEKLRQKGIPVIESYPGAAQDIMMIPRKQAGLDYLVMGLREFGIRGDFSATGTSHDELDAITSATVGLFFLAGKFEALGNPLEEYLIIPDLNGDSRTWLFHKVIGVMDV